MQLDSRFTVRCTVSEREAWHRWALDHGTNLSTMTRTVLNNLSGVNDPPDFSRYSDAEVQHWNGATAETLKRRRLPSAPTTVALILALILFVVLGTDEASAVARHVTP